MKQCNICKTWRKSNGLLHKCNHCGKWLCWNCYFNDNHIKDWVKSYGIKTNESVNGQTKLGWTVPRSERDKTRYGNRVHADIKQEDLGNRKKEADVSRSKTVQW